MNATTAKLQNYETIGTYVASGFGGGERASGAVPLHLRVPLIVRLQPVDDLGD